MDYTRTAMVHNRVYMLTTGGSTVPTSEPLLRVYNPSLNSWSILPMATAIDKSSGRVGIDRSKVSLQYVVPTSTHGLLLIPAALDYGVYSLTNIRPTPSAVPTTPTASLSSKGKGKSDGKSTPLHGTPVHHYGHRCAYQRS